MAKKKRRGKKERRSRSKKGGNFKYKSRDKEKWEARADQSGFSRRSMYVDDVKTFRAHEDENLIRILPPTFDDAEHYGLEIFVHYGIGPDGDSFLCQNVMNNDPCPICEERTRALKDGDKEYADKLKAGKRVCVYIVDRDDEDEGLLMWAMPWTMDADITTLAVDKRTGEVLDVDDPVNGYDIEFTKKGKGINTKYSGVAIARKSSKLKNATALEDAVETPLPEILKFYEYDEIEKIFNAGGGYDGDEEEEEEEEEERGGRKRRRRDEEEEDPPRKKKGKKRRSRDEEEEEEEEESEVDWKQVQDMDLDELEELVEEEDLDIDCDVDDEDDDEMQDLRDEVCDELDLQKPKKRKAKKSEKEKIRKRKRRR